ncbi:hypothetical protein [Aurantiacibacter marinus]|nr:hypothetical protein [Aurantiacibacter marinus]
MTNTNDITGRIFAAIGALAISATLFISSFANPAATTFTRMLV